MTLRTAFGNQRVAWWVVAGAILALVTLYAPDAAAQVDDTEARFKGVLDAFRDQSILWQSTLTASARWLFFTLAIISFLWANIGLALKGGDPSDFINTNVKEVLRAGFMYVLLVHAFDWSTAVVMSFRQAGQSAVSASAGGGADVLDPAGIFQAGLIVAGSLFEQVSIWAGADNVGLVICALTLIICFAVLAAYMAVAIVESYLVIGGAVFLLGFGGSTVTADIAKRAAMYCVSVGAKLFVMQLIVGVTMGTVLLWAQTFENDSSTSTLSLVGLVLLVTVLAKSVPETVQGLLSGTSFAGPASMLSTVAAAAAAGTAAGAAVMAGSSAGGAAGAANGAASALGGGAGGGGVGGGGGMGQAFSAASPHMGRAAVSLADAAGGVNLGGALSSLTGALRPDAPSMSMPGDGGGDGGTISGAGQPASPSEPTPAGQQTQGGPAAAGGGGRQSEPAATASTAAPPTHGAVPGGPAGQASHSNPSSPPSSSSPASSVGAGSAAGGVASVAAGASGAPPGTASNGGGRASPSTLDERAAGSQASGVGEGATTGNVGAGEAGASGDQPAGGTGVESGVGYRAEPSSGGQGGASAGTDQAATPRASESAESSLQASESSRPQQPADSDPATLDERVYAQDTGQPSLDVASYANDGAQPGVQSGGFDQSRRMTQAKRGAVVGAVLGGPAGAAIGAAVGAAAAPKIDAVGAAAAAAFAKAKQRFGLGNSSGDSAPNS